MLLFGHLGITLAAAKILDYAVVSKGRLSTESTQQTQDDKGAQIRKTSLMEKIDIRLLLLGALLPDIIDKPLGHIFLRDTLDNGRIYGHTLLFLIIISIAAFYLWNYKHKTWLLPVAFGVFMHFVLDEMWLNHHTLLWPFFGWTFPQEHWDFYFREILSSLFKYPKLYITETIGGLILIWFAIPIVRKKNVRNFLRTGIIQ